MISSSPEMFFRYYKAVKSQGIGCNQSDNGDYDQALLSLQESLEVFKEFQNDFLISNCYFSIGNVLFSKSQYEEALVSYRKALEIYREIHGENHGRTCCCYESIGNVLSAQGRYDDALIGYGKSLAIRKKIYGDNHIDIGRSYYNIGLGQLKKGDYNGALISLEKAKEICSRELGSEHPRTVQLTVYIDFCQKHNIYLHSNLLLYYRSKIFNIFTL